MAAEKVKSDIFPYLQGSSRILHICSMMLLILMYLVIGEQRFLRDRFSLIVPTISDCVRAAENFKSKLKHTSMS